MHPKHIILILIIRYHFQQNVGPRLQNHLNEHTHTQRFEHKTCSCKNTDSFYKKKTTKFNEKKRDAGAAGADICSPFLHIKM